jgi:chlorophyllide a reductase subunit Z
MLEKIVAKHSPLTRISATKTLRDQAEKIALQKGDQKVAKETIEKLDPEQKALEKKNKVA